jgi:hypothetical protein
MKSGDLLYLPKGKYHEAKMQIRHEHSQLSLLSIARFDLPNKIIGQNFSVRTIATHIKRQAKIGN